MREENSLDWSKNSSRYFFPITNKHIVLDFSSGSATTAHAVMQLNAEDGGHCKFIMVQLPEKCDEQSEACKGYWAIAGSGILTKTITNERLVQAGYYSILDRYESLHLCD